MYSEVSNKHGVFLILFRKFSQLHALLEPPCLLVSEKHATNTVFYVINIKKIPTTSLLESPRLFDFGKISYLHIIRAPRLLETSEYNNFH